MTRTPASIRAAARTLRPGGSCPFIGTPVALIAVLLWSFLMSVEVVADQTTSKVLVVNSDGAVEKYQVAQQAFVESLGGPVKVLDLSRLSDREAQRAIRAEAASAVYGIGARASVAASRAVRGRPVVISSVINWSRLPEARSPRVHVVANELSSESQLTMFRYFFPDVKRIGVLYSREYNREWLESAVASGKGIGLEVIGIPVRSTRASETALKSLLPKIDALWVASDPVVLADETAVRRLFGAIAAARKPSFTYTSAFAGFGPTLIVAPDAPTIGRQAAAILRDASIGPIKQVQNPAGSEVILNLGAVRDYGLRLNDEARDSVNRFIR